MSPDAFDPSNITNRPNVKSVINSNFKNQKRQLVLCIKTTGFFPTTGDRIIEIGIIELVDRKLTDDYFHVYLNPERPVGGSELMHGFSDDFLNTRPLFMDVVDEIEAYILGAEVIAHNAKLDMHFLDEEMKKCGREPLSKRIKVTNCIEIAKEKFPRRINSLDVLAERLNVFHFHSNICGALMRAGTLADVYLTLTRGANNGRYKILEENQDPLYEKIRRYVIETQKVDATDIQHRFSIDHNRFTKIVYSLEKNRIISTIGASGEHHVH